MWKDYWTERQPWTYPELFEVNARIFFDHIAARRLLTPASRVLNIGCGPGYLERLLSPHVQAIDALDVSRPMLDAARRVCRDCANVNFLPLGDTYTDLAFLSGPYDLIFCISTLQYYRDEGEAERLLRSVERLAAPGAALVLADLPQRRRPLEDVRDGITGLFMAFRRGYGILYLKKWIGNIDKFFAYRGYAKTSPHLDFKPEDLENLLARMGWTYDWIDRDLSICPHRLNLIVRF